MNFINLIQQKKSYNNEKINEILQNIRSIDDIINLKDKWYNIRHNKELQKLYYTIPALEKLNTLVGMDKLKNGKRGDDNNNLDKLGFDLRKYSGFDKKKALRNCVTPEIGLAIFESSLNIYKQKINNIGLFKNLNNGKE